MTIKAYPLIYSRTKFVDYLSDFLVRPEDFPTDLASKYINRAIEDIFFSNGIRHLVFSTGNFFIYGGVACSSNDIIARIKYENGLSYLDFEYEKYLNDEKGRPLVFFIGFAIKKQDLVAGYVPDISLYETYNIFLQHLKLQWEAKITEPEYVNAIAINAIQFNRNINPIEKDESGIRFIENYSENKYVSFIQHYFHEMTAHPNDNISFLSQVLSYNITKDFPFTYVSVCDCSLDEAIKHFKAKSESSYNLSIQAETNTVERDCNNSFQIDPIEAQSFKKKTKPRGIIAILISIILLIAVLLALKMTATKKAKTHSSPNSLTQTAVEQKAIQVLHGDYET